MILKVYIKSHMFQLPRKQDDLTELIKERLYKNKKLVKSAITKLYPISEVDNENIIIKRNTNIFLLNLYLLVLQEKEELAFTEKTILDNETLFQKLKEKTNLDVSNVSIEEAEKIILNYLYPNENQTTHDTITEDTKDTDDTFQNIEFSMSWIKKAHYELQKRRR